MFGSRRAAYALAALFWLALWHFGSLLVGSEILLVSPLAAASRLFEMAGTPAFWKTAGFSLARIMGGFMLALVSGVLLAAASYRSKIVSALLAPLTGAAKSVPVASYAILCIFLFGSRSLSLVISFMMTLPIVYDTVLEGLRNTDSKLLDMAQVFCVTKPRRVRAIYIPQSLPYLISSVGVGVGIAWKSGVAAEVIGLANGSIGSELYVAKNYLDMRSLFAWTMAVMFLSFMLEKLILTLIKRGARAIERL
ncbi:MAG: ABC transporter permease subunit [Oscillospiraceae bacterium]|nr:ABC transporter permease subunit [Oscillospiraceae bacterium]